MKLKISLLSLAFAFAFVPALGFAAPGENFGGNQKAWVEDDPGHFVNDNNPENIKDWNNHQFAAPGNAGMHASEKSAVSSLGGGMIVKPQNKEVPRGPQ